MKKELDKEYEKKLKKAGIAAISVSVLTAGAVGIVSAYQNGKDYKPSKNERNIQDNQVVFSDNDTIGHKKDKNKEDSELLKKDKKEKNGAEQEDNKGYLFENSSMLMPEKNTASIIAEGTGIADAGGTNKGTVYNLTRDASNADMLINGGSKTKGNGLKENFSGSNNENPDKKSDPDQKKDEKGTKDREHNESDNKKDEENDNPAPSKPRPSANAKDPETRKNTPSSGIVDYKPFVEGIIPKTDTDTEGENVSVIILPVSEYDANMLYKGQSVDENIIYNAFDTFVAGKDGSAYVWGTESYGKYIRVSGISFDGGASWIDEFPVTIPKNLEDGKMKIRMEFRTSLKQEKWGVRDIDYDPKNTRLFILSRDVREGEEKIDPETIINGESQYPDAGTKVNLLRFQERYLGTDRLTKLFPGWMEDGTLVQGFYPVTDGRHILEPAEMVDLDSSYVVKLKYVWMSEDYKVDGNRYDNLCYLQTLTDMDTPWKASWSDDGWQAFSSFDTLTVPKYVQAVMIDEQAGLSVNYLKIPDTVLYIETQKSGMRVNKGYVVDKDNLNYSSTSEGLLMNKEGTEILSIPYGKTSITVPDTVTKFKVEKNNQLKKVIIKRTQGEELPEINYTNLKNCKIVVDEEHLEDVLTNNQKYFTKKTGNTVVSSKNQNVKYYVEDGMIVDDSGNLRKVLESGNKRIKLPEDVQYIQTSAFEENKNVTSLIMPQNGKKVEFEKEALENSGVNTILCYGEKQYEFVKTRLEQFGLDNITVEILKKSKEGYGYSVEYIDGVESCTLIDAPEDVEFFDGTVTAEDGTPVQITELGENVFNGCENLTWAFLPESVEMIGSQSFLGCSNLQGILIRNTEKITIGNKAFDGCDSLRFIGSNAMDGEFLDGYSPMVTDSRNKMKYFYVPSGAAGYNENCVAFTEDSGVASYDVISDGGNGWILYGMDTEGEPWLALRSGETVAENALLPETTMEIYSYAFADTKAEKGDFYTIDFENTMTWALDEGAFYMSDIGKDVVLNTDSYVFDYAFQQCEKIESIELPGTGDLNLGQAIVNGCTNLKTAKIGIMDGDMYTGLFTGCPQLTDVYFENETPPRLTGVFYSGHRFNYDWTIEEESQNLHIHVPEGTEKEYVKAWRYDYVGYEEFQGQNPPYLRMWQDVQTENVNWETWELPEDSVVDEKTKEKLLIYENYIWTMLGKEPKAEPVDFYPYHVDENGYIRLAGVPSDVTEVNLYDTEFMGLPEGWYYDGIEPYAFAGAKNLKKITLPYNLSELSNNAFAGVETDSLTVVFDEYWAIDLVMEDGQPFSFGVDDSVLHLEVPEEMQDEYIKEWSYRLAGYQDLESMRTAVKAELAAKGTEPSDEEVDTEIAGRLLLQVNRLRKMMGLEEIEKLDTDAFGLNVQEEAEKAKEPETDSKDQNPDQTEETKKDQNTQMPQESGDADQNIQMPQESGDADQNTQTPQEDDNTEQSNITKEEGDTGQSITGSGKEINE